MSSVLIGRERSGGSEYPSNRKRRPDIRSIQQALGLVDFYLLFFAGRSARTNGTERNGTGTLSGRWSPSGRDHPNLTRTYPNLGSPIDIVICWNELNLAKSGVGERTRGPSRLIRVLSNNLACLAFPHNYKCLISFYF